MSFWPTISPGTATRAVICATTCLLAGACASLLGDDFSVRPNETDTASGTGSANGGAGGSVGGGSSNGGAGTTGGMGGTGATPLPYACDWKFNEHDLVMSQENTEDQWSGGQMHMVGAGNDARLFIQNSNSNGGALQIHTLNENNANLHTLSARDVDDAQRLTKSKVAVLYHREVGSDPNKIRELHMYVINDNDQDGSNGVDHTLTDTDKWPLPNGISLDFEASFVAAPGGDDADVDFIVSYSNEEGDFFEAYGRYRGAPVDPVVISMPSADLGEQDTDPSGLIHHDGTTYAFMGQPGAPAGLRQYALDGDVTGPIMARQVAPLAAFAGAAQGPDGFAAALAEIGMPITLFIGELDYASLPTFTQTDLNEGPSYQTLSDLPVGEGDSQFIDSVFAFAGTQPLDDLNFGYLFISSDGKPRGGGQLTFNYPSLPMSTERLDIERFQLVPRDGPLFGALGGDLSVAFTESEKNAAGETYLALYFDQWECHVVEE